jgi:6,7-dimethyl-8-ribityllumazine synthase
VTVSVQSDPPGERSAPFAILVARFYEELAERLLAGAQGSLREHGLDYAVYEVPGAFELPLAAHWAAQSGRFAGIICLGAVIRGETDHYDYVCAEVARGTQAVALAFGLPCSFGVLTCGSYEQARARADGSKRDQGRRAAEAAIAMARLRAEIGAGAGARGARRESV